MKKPIVLLKKFRFNHSTGTIGTYGINSINFRSLWFYSSIQDMYNRDYAGPYSFLSEMRTFLIEK